MLAVATLAGVAAAFVFLHIGSGTAGHAGDAQAVTTAAAGLDRAEMTVDAHYAVTGRMLDGGDQGLRHRYLASLAAARSMRQQAAARRAAARHAAARRAAQAQRGAASAGGAPAHPDPVTGRHPVQQRLGRGPLPTGSVHPQRRRGRQLRLGSRERRRGLPVRAGHLGNLHGGAASEFGVAGPAYQDQIFDNAIAAGGASNWTAYDGC